MVKIQCIVFLVLFMLFSCIEMPVQDDVQMNPNTMSELYTFSNRPVVFYNVENLFDTKNDPSTNDDDFTPYGFKEWDETRYAEKLERISSVLSFLDELPALIGLVEVENREVLKALCKTGELSSKEYGIVHYDSPDRRGIDCALLYDKDVFKVVESTKYAVRLNGNRNFATRDILYVQGKLMGDVTLHVFVNHWSSRREGQKETEHKRIAAAETLRSKVDQLQKNDPSANILILGDFNDHPTDKSLEDILRAKESGYASDGDLINLLSDDHKDGLGTSVHNREWGVIDQIIVSQAFYDGSSGISFENRDAEILKRPELLYTYPDGNQKPSSTYGGKKYYGGFSDHLPVYILLK